MVKQFILSIWLLDLEGEIMQAEIKHDKSGEFNITLITLDIS